MKSQADLRDMSKRLIFLICQPRSGSTLLQHILGSHPEIHTLPEPWFMLHLVYALRERGIVAEYQARYAYLALRDFLKRLGEGEECYLDGIRHTALRLYAAALRETGKQFFLDKTPRYYLIVQELYRLFPEARFILLVRNPLAVFSSILNVSLQGRLRGFCAEDRRHDIISAPRLILEATEKLGSRAVRVSYEELVSQPERAVQEICRKFALVYDPAMLEYGSKVRLDGSFLDSKSIDRHTEPVKDYVADWPRYLNTTEKVRMARAYLQALGKGTVERLGYSYTELQHILDGLGGRRWWFGVPWDRLLVEEPSLSRFDLVKLSALKCLGQRDARGILHYYRRGAFRTRS